MHYIHQDGQQVFKYAVKKMAEMTERVLQKNGLTGADVDCFIAHQANKRIILATAERLKMPLEKVVINIERYGNTTAGTIPLAMQTAVNEGKLKEGKSGVAGCGWRGLHVRRDAVTLGILAGWTYVRPPHIALCVRARSF